MYLEKVQLQTKLVQEIILVKTILQYKDWTVEVFDDFGLNQTLEHLDSYDKIYQAGKDKEFNPTSQHGIVVIKENVKKSSAILRGVAGVTTVTPDSVLIYDDNLIIRCSNNVYSLGLPDLNLNWMTEVDWTTCFSIHKYGESFITHGEVEVARIDRKGNILWCYSGADIFVCAENGNPSR